MLKHVARPAVGSRLSVVGDTVTVLQQADGFELFRLDGAKDSGPPPHSHPWDETYFVLDGEVEVMLDGESAVHGPEDSFHVPAGGLHTFRIASPTAAFLVVTSGDRAGAFFADLDANVAHGAPNDETLPGIIDVAKRNGLSSPLFA
ncbi:MAG: cupin domain-containing protein [Acidimicrobiia bacterium]